MENELKIENTQKRTSSLIKSVIQDSKKLRAERGEDFYSEKKNTVTIFEAPQTVNQVTSQIQTSSEQISPPEKNFQTLRESHVKLAHLIVQYDKKFFDQSNQVLNAKKTRSKSIHLYIDEKIEHFLKTESQKSETKWGLRKNAGLGQLIQKFIGNFIELKQREEKQLKHIKKIIDEFRVCLVEFKKFSSEANEYMAAESSNKKMKVLSNDLQILLSLLEFEDESLKNCLGIETHKWVDFVVKWKFHS